MYVYVSTAFAPAQMEQFGSHHKLNQPWTKEAEIIKYTYVGKQSL